jgi:hypothetical protein
MIYKVDFHFDDRSVQTIRSGRMRQPQTREYFHHFSKTLLIAYDRFHVLTIPPVFQITNVRANVVLDIQIKTNLLTVHRVFNISIRHGTTKVTESEKRERS